jgi:hypothetical protein
VESTGAVIKPLKTQAENKPARSKLEDSTPLVLSGVVKSIPLGDGVPKARLEVIEKEIAELQAEEEAERQRLGREAAGRVSLALGGLWGAPAKPKAPKAPKRTARPSHIDFGKMFEPQNWAYHKRKGAVSDVLLFALSFWVTVGLLTLSILSLAR